jgi:hypothetical protein
VLDAELALVRAQIEKAGGNVSFDLTVRDVSLQARADLLVQNVQVRPPSARTAS